MYTVGDITLTAGEAIPENSLVYVSAANTVSVAGAADIAIGVAKYGNGDVALGGLVTVCLFGPVIPMVAAGAVLAGIKVYGKDNGKVDDTTAAGDLPIGVPLQAAAADGDLIRVVALPHIAVAAS